MARAFIVLARNDLEDNLIQVLDLKPNSSQFLPSQDGQNGGQTGYQTWYARDAAVNATVATQAGAGGGASLDTVVVYYGLAAYLIANVEDQGGLKPAITAAVANATKNAIFALVAAGSPVTVAAVNNALVANGVANATVGTTLTTNASTGVLESMLRILAGEVWRLPALTQVTAAGGAFVAAAKGAFVTRPIVEGPSSHEGTYGPVRGRKYSSPLPFLIPGTPRAGQAPVQTGTHDVLFHDVRTVVDTGELHLSALSGALSHLKAPTYSFLNSAFTYAGGAIPAQTIAAGNVPATGVARAVVIYDASGNVL